MLSTFNCQWRLQEASSSPKSEKRGHLNLSRAMRALWIVMPYMVLCAKSYPLPPKIWAILPTCLQGSLVNKCKSNVNKSNHTLETMNAAENLQHRKRHIEVKLWKTVVNGTKGTKDRWRWCGITLTCYHGSLTKKV